LLDEYQWVLADISILTQSRQECHFIYESARKLVRKLLHWMVFGEINSMVMLGRWWSYKESNWAMVGSNARIYRGNVGGKARLEELSEKVRASPTDHRGLLPQAPRLLLKSVSSWAVVSQYDRASCIRIDSSVWQKDEASATAHVAAREESWLGWSLENKVEYLR
jgi:hypothetical protein